MNVCKTASADIAYKLLGDSGTTIVIDAAVASCSAEWWHIAERLHGAYRVLVYDRPGYGQSSCSSKDRTPANIATELDELLGKLGIHEDIILVGHSQGGFYAVQYALMFPRRLRALILLDPATPFDGEFLQELPLRQYRRLIDKTASFRLGLLTTSLRLGSLLKPLLAGAAPFCYHDYSPEAKRYLFSALCSRATYKTALAEIKYTHSDDTVQTVRDGIAQRGLLDLPLRLLTHSSSVYADELKRFAGVSDATAITIEAVWQPIMRRFLDLSSNSQHAVAPRSGHYIHLTDYDLLASVIESV